MEISSYHRKFQDYKQRNSELLSHLRTQCTESIIQDVLRKISILLYIEERSQRASYNDEGKIVSYLRTFLPEKVVDILRITVPGVPCNTVAKLLLGKGYDTSHKIMEGNNCHSTSQVVSGEITTLIGNNLYRYGKKQDFINEGWYEIALEEAEKCFGFPFLGTIGSPYGSIKHFAITGQEGSDHSFIVLGKLNDEYICFDQNGIGGSFRLFPMPLNFYVHKNSYVVYKGL